MNNPKEDWSAWQAMMADMANYGLEVEGWVKCRIGNRDGRGGEKVNWVFGIAKGDFGIWLNSYPVCDHVKGETTTMVLAAMTCVRTGLGMGLFADATTAIEAADLIQGNIDWRASPLTDTTAQDANYWALTLTKVHRSWEFAGIDHSVELHAHAFPGGPQHGVWVKTKAGITAERPEKLS